MWPFFLVGVYLRFYSLLQQRDKSLAFVARNVVGLLVDCLNLDEVAPLGGVNLDKTEAFEVDEFTEIAKETDAAEYRKLCAHISVISSRQRICKVCSVTTIERGTDISISAINATMNEPNHAET